MAPKLNPKTEHYEFMGPPGALFVTVAVPLTTYALFFGCSEAAGGCPPSFWTLPPRFIETISDPQWWFSLFELRPLLIYLAWYAYCVTAWKFLPGAWVGGVQMRDGNKKLYKINGMCAF
jgi:hypothetical protein